MLTFHDQKSRREFLRLGSLAMGGAALAPWMTPHANAAVQSAVLTGKSVIFLFMHGGPSQIETFDPKMDMPAEIRSATGEVSTKLPGITFGGTFPKLAQVADKLSIIRSFKTGDGNHDIKPIVGKDTFGANLGSLYARVAGTNHPQTGLPNNVALFPRAIDPERMERIQQFGRFDSTGEVGAAFAPFIPGAGGDLQENMKLKLPMDRIGDRQTLLSSLDAARWVVESSSNAGRIDSLRSQAFDTILGGAADAFDLSKEDPKTVARYDTSPLVKPQDISKRWNNYERYVDNSITLGKLLLMARRLCERGVGFVTVTTNFVWDMHSDANNAGVDEGMRYMGLPFDHAVSALIEDIHQRGLENDILLVCCGEMGRNPRINARGGRDHWGNLSPLMLSGGGLNMGQVIGQSKRDASEPLTSPLTIKHLLATILHTQFNVGELRLQPELPGDLTRKMASWDPIPGLL
ncbi:MAG: DUF1501 domain-containing protein [Planctomycetaceae bacterium]|nr:DUF1501 domain-containing protein [Planctomycetaceae bacterium]